MHNFVFMIMHIWKINYNLMRNAEFGIRNEELMVATLRFYNVAFCLDKFVFLGVIDISDTFRDVWEPVPYGNVCFPL